jgi:hypothetical protein
MNNQDQFKTPEERLAKFKDVHEEIDNETNRTANEIIESAGEETANLSAQGDDNEKKENLGGSTNLSLDQLKQGDAQPDDDNE